MSESPDAPQGQCCGKSTNTAYANNDNVLPSDPHSPCHLGSTGSSKHVGNHSNASSSDHSDGKDPSLGSCEARADGGASHSPHVKQCRGRSEQSLHEQLYLLEQQYLHQKYLRRQHRRQRFLEEKYLQQESLRLRFLEEKYLQQESLEEKYLEQQYHLKQQYLKQHGVLPPLPQQGILDHSPLQLPPLQQGVLGQYPPQQPYPSQQQAPDRSSQQQSPLGQSSSSSSSTDEMQDGDMISSSPLSPLSDSPPDVVSSALANPTIQQQSSPQPSAQQKVWVTIQNYSMFVNTMSPQSRENIISTQLPCTRTFFTLCSLAKYISQFDLTDPDAAEKVKTDKKSRMYYNLYSEFPPATLTVTMTLHFLFNAPQMYLPLAPFHDAIYSAIELASMFQFAHGRRMSSFDTICQLVTGILTMRIRHAVSCLYPHLTLLWGGSVPKLEDKRPPILGWLARDTLAAFNPIEIMLMYYRPIMAEFDQILSPTSEDCRLYLKRFTSIAPWLHSMHSMCMMYGLHIYDSQWVSMDTWRELAGYMNTILTKIAPDLFDVVQGKHPDPTNDEERRQIVFTKDWYVGFLACLAPCFTHHYRPMDEPRLYNVPFGNWPQDISKLPCYIIPSAYSDMLENLPTALEQYATMYAEDPTQFECEGSQSLSHDTDGNNPFTITPSSIRSEFDNMMNKTSPKRVKEPYTFKKYYQRLSLQVPRYLFARFPLQYLIRAIVECPPRDDLVYSLFAPWFTRVTHHLDFMKPEPGMIPPDPKFIYHHHPSSTQSQSPVND